MTGTRDEQWIDFYEEFSSHHQEDDDEDSTSFRFFLAQKKKKNTIIGTESSFSNNNNTNRKIRDATVKSEHWADFHDRYHSTTPEESSPSSLRVSLLTKKNMKNRRNRKNSSSCMKKLLCCFNCFGTSFFSPCLAISGRWNVISLLALLLVVWRFL